MQDLYLYAPALLQGCSTAAIVPFDWPRYFFLNNARALSSSDLPLCSSRKVCPPLPRLPTYHLVHGANTTHAHYTHYNMAAVAPCKMNVCASTTANKLGARRAMGGRAAVRSASPKVVTASSRRACVVTSAQYKVSALLKAGYRVMRGFSIARHAPPRRQHARHEPLSRKLLEDCGGKKKTYHEFVFWQDDPFTPACRARRVKFSAVLVRIPAQPAQPCVNLVRLSCRPLLGHPNRVRDTCFACSALPLPTPDGAIVRRWLCSAPPVESASPCPCCLR